MSSTSEKEIAIAAMKIASQKADGLAKFEELYDEIPNLIQLTSDDLAPSQTRNGEPMWHQIVRNIQSHHQAEGNAINEGWLDHVPNTGYRITTAGRRKI